MIKIYGRRSSINVQKVLWTLAELGQPFERVTVGGSFGGNTSDEYLAMNPQGLVPVLVDGSITMFESNAIVRYLSARYGEGSLRPAEPRALAAAEQWMEWQQMNVYPLVTTIFLNLVRTPLDQRDPKAVRAAEMKLPRLLAMADIHLSRQVWFAGEAFTMADIVMGCLYWRYSQLETEKPEARYIGLWFDRLQQRKPYQDWVMVPVGRNPEEWAKNERDLA
jgi:glutathione S-transferase